jgi:TetR/AcrR family transcriptional regulator
MRTKQREETRNKIIKAAISAISESGFDGTSTRAIANRAEVSQGLLSYHFKTKELLWRAAADYLFSTQTESIQTTH